MNGTRATMPAMRTPWNLTGEAFSHLDYAINASLRLA